MSSGVGHKVFVGGRIVGPSGRGGEIGHWVVDPSPDRLCATAADAASAPWRPAAAHVCWRAAARASSRGCSVNLRSVVTVPPTQNNYQTGDLVASFADDDAWTVRLISDVATPLGRALGAIHLTVGVERFVIVGGLRWPWANAIERCSPVRPARGLSISVRIGTQ